MIAPSARLGRSRRQAAGEETVEEQRFQLRARRLRRQRVGEQARTAPGNRNCEDLIRRGFATQHSFLERPAPRDEVVPLPSGKPARRKARFEQMRDCKIDVIAAEQDVVADGDPRDPGITAALILAEFKQAEVRSAAPNVDHQNMARGGLWIW